MSYKRISQRDAVRLRKRVTELEYELERQRHSWVSEWPSFMKIAVIRPDAATLTAIRTARILKHAVVMVPDGENVNVIASKL